MTKEDIIKEIDALETQLFFLNMKDTWSGDDYETERKYERRIKELKKELEVME